ncbi:MAG: serine/threonine-protein kinase [Holophagaceae bacterium]|nr:serine/threonine-protein kinase [Holophagaceae bacterium]
MTLTPGTKLGPYEVLSPLGAGGMGEVWKAKDTRLDRFVAIKVLPEHLATHPEALARFEREAKAVAALNHPNIMALHDLGNQDGVVYEVMELLEGESLRARLAAGPLPPRKATELAVQLAHGLAAAHAKGVVHRDLKPDNLWITKDGRLKILDFGLAKQVSAFGGGSGSLMPTEAMAAGAGVHTEEGMILGTVGYMSPEQVRGEAVDARSDIFSFGTVLFEMLTGKKAFARNTTSDTLAAILRDDPPDLEESSRPLPGGLLRILEHCLEKDPAHRFQETHDLAFALQNLSSASESSVAFKAPFEAQNRRVTWKWAAVGAGLLLVAALAGWALRGGRPPEPVFQQLTFRRGNVLRARYAPDGQGIYYSATWDGGVTRMFRMKAEGGEATPFGPPKADFLAVGREGQVLFLQKAEGWGATSTSGTLSLLSSEGSEPKALAPQCRTADMAADGSIAAAFAPSGGVARLEWPLGTKILDVTGTIADLHIAPDGRAVAFWQQDDRGWTAMVADRQGKAKALATFVGADGLCWSADSRTILACLPNYPGAQTNGLVAIGLDGSRRLLRTDPSLAIVHDARPDGTLLWEREMFGTEVQIEGPGRQPRRIALSKGTTAVALSRDGRKLLLQTTLGLGARESTTTLVWDEGGAPPLNLGRCAGLDFSPDSAWILAWDFQKAQLLKVPLGMGLPKVIPLPWKDPVVSSIRFGADADQIFALCKAGPTGFTVESLDLRTGTAKTLLKAEETARVTGGTRHPSDPGLRLRVLEGGVLATLDLRNGQVKTLSTKLGEGDQLAGWMQDGALVLRRPGTFEIPLEQMDPQTGARRPWKVLKPQDATGLIRIDNVFVSPDAQTWAFNYVRVTESNLFVVKGVR